MKPTCFGLLDFTAGYHQTPPYFQRSTQTKVFHGLVYNDDVLTHGKTDTAFLTNTRQTSLSTHVSVMKTLTSPVQYTHSVQYTQYTLSVHLISLCVDASHSCS